MLVGLISKTYLDKNKEKSMKRIGYLYEKVFTKENLMLAIKEASKHKKDRTLVDRVLSNPDYYVQEIQKNPHISGDYKHLVKTDSLSGKTREILEPPFYPDQIIHHAVCQVLEPIFMRGMYKWCCGSVKNKGTLYASKHVRKALITKKSKTTYFVKIDIVKYYPNVNHNILKEKFEKRIKDKKMLSLIYEIIDSVKSGLPIGNYTSQWFANFFLQDYDHYVVEKLTDVTDFTRYADDMLFMGCNKRRLKKNVISAIEYLNSELGLSVHEEWIIKKVADKKQDKGGNGGEAFIDFCGFRHYRGFTTIRRRIYRRIHRLVIRLHQEVTLQRAKSFMSYWGYIVNSNSKHFLNKYIKRKFISLEKCKSIISTGGIA